MEKTCPHCGAPLPKEAAFCPYCARCINSRSVLKRPYPGMRKTLWMFLPLFLAAAVFFSIFLRTRPRTYDGMGEVIYTDKSGTYQLVINNLKDRYTPVPVYETMAGFEESYRSPIWLYVSDLETGADASEPFMQNLESVGVRIDQPSDSPSPIQCTKPEPKDFNTDAALVSLIDYTRESSCPAQAVWTLSMKNGDTIYLRMDLSISPSVIYNFSSDNADLSDSRALQALIDWAAEETNPEDSVIIHLPAITYTEPIVLKEHAVNLTGSSQNGQRTTFTGGIQMTRGETSNYSISYFTGIDFVGDGTGVGISAANRLWAKDCRFSNWKTGLLSFGNVWINATDCTFENNSVGLHYNSENVTAGDTHFTGNHFIGNGTALLLENVPTDVLMNFSGCIFYDNEADIDNRCNQSIDLSQAEFPDSLPVSETYEQGEDTP